MDLIARVTRICGSGLADRPLRAQLLEAVASVVPFEAHVFALTDPVSRVVSSPHASVPMVSMEELPALIRRRYLTPDPVQWLEALAGIGVVDVATVALEDRYGAWGFLELWRTTASYSRVERATLAALVPVITAGLRAAAARTFVDPAEELPPIESGVVLLDADLRVRSQTAAGAAVLLQLLPPDEPAPPVPAAAYNAGAALLAAEQGAGAWDPMARVHLGSNRWVVVRAARLGDEIAVSIAPATAAERTDLYARVHGMSRRETEVLALAVLGLDSRAIAAELVIAPTTAEDHLKALLAKARVPSRQVLISRALGAR